METGSKIDTVYKSCGKWIVILQILEDTIINTRSDIVDSLYAKYRANKLLVFNIVHKLHSNKTTNSVQNTSYVKKITYTVGEIVYVPDFDQNLDIVCSTGIHFFYSYKAAYYYEPVIGVNKRYKWFDNGCKNYKGKYLDGARSGLWLEWHDNGNKKYEGNFLNGKETGSYTAWYKNGQMKCLGKFSNGLKDGSWTTWYDNGQLEYSGTFGMNGLESGWELWLSDGQKVENVNDLKNKYAHRGKNWFANGYLYTEID
jgi:Family of unknown function (DUF5758)